MRDHMRAIWEFYIRRNAARNPGHCAYYFCYETDDDNGITAFQVFTSREAKEKFLNSEWYPEYLHKVADYITEPPQITEAEVLWTKHE